MLERAQTVSFHTGGGGGKSEPQRNALDIDLTLLLVRLLGQPCESLLEVRLSRLSVTGLAIVILCIGG